ncbi:MAG TPA: hypothetical protein VF933_25705 [Streptosporangiaceae bacterium]
MAGAVDLAVPLLPVLGVGDGTAEGEGEVDATEVLGVGVPDDVPAEGVGLAGVDPAGVADGVLEGWVSAFRDEWPLSVSPTLVPAECPPETATLSGLPIDSSNTVMPAMTTRKNPPAMLP